MKNLLSIIPGHSLRLQWTPVLVRACACFLITAGCTSEKEKEASINPTFTVGVVYDKGGKDDKAFNSMVEEGLARAKAEHSVEIKDVEPNDDNSYEPSLNALAQRGVPLIIAVGFTQKAAVERVAPKHPKTHFLLIDAEVNAPNVTSAVFADHEGSFLVGYLAARHSKTSRIGFLGGMDVPLIRRFHLGYEAGAKHFNPKIELNVQYVGVTGEAWANPNRAKELAKNLYSKGIDIIFGAAGKSNLGLFDAAEERSAFAIGVDSNQNWIKPGRIITSMVKRVDEAVFQAISSFKKSELKGGTLAMDLKNNGVGFSLDDHNRDLIAKYVKDVEEIRQQIIDGRIKVPDYYEKQKK